MSTNNRDNDGGRQDDGILGLDVPIWGAESIGRAAGVLDADGNVDLQRVYYLLSDARFHQRSGNIRRYQSALIFGQTRHIRDNHHGHESSLGNIGKQCHVSHLLPGGG
jgi:hypothetical protein